MRRILWGLLLIGLAGGCAGVLSPEALQSVDPGVDLVQVRENPAAYEGRTLLLGGQIVKTEVGEKGAVLEVLSYTLDRWEEPRAPSEAGGRFLVRTDRFLDPEIYKAGRLVTLTGTVVGEEVRPLKDYQYRYPVFRLDEIHVWAAAETYRGYGGPYQGPYPSYSHWPYPYYYDPFWGPYDPFWGRPYDPFWPRYHYW